MAAERLTWAPVAVRSRLPQRGASEAGLRTGRQNLGPVANSTQPAAAAAPAACGGRLNACRVNAQQPRGRRRRATAATCRPAAGGGVGRRAGGGVALGQLPRPRSQRTRQPAGPGARHRRFAAAPAGRRPAALRGVRSDLDRIPPADASRSPTCGWPRSPTRCPACSACTCSTHAVGSGPAACRRWSDSDFAARVRCAPSSRSRNPTGCTCRSLSSRRTGVHTVTLSVRAVRARRQLRRRRHRGARAGLPAHADRRHAVRQRHVRAGRPWRQRSGRAAASRARGRRRDRRQPAGAGIAVPAPCCRAGSGAGADCRAARPAADSPGRGG